MASSPVNPETSQAFFCAIADYLGEREAKLLKKCGTYKELKREWPKTVKLERIYAERVRSKGVPYAQIESFLEENPDWYQSSVSIALELIQQLGVLNTKFNKLKNAGWQDVFYYRADELTAAIKSIYDQCNEFEDYPFSDINKWSPADIYYASDKGKDDIIQVSRLKRSQGGISTFDHFNEFMLKLYMDGDILPLSLKKAKDRVALELANNFKYPKGAKRPLYEFYGCKMHDSLVENKNYHESVVSHSLEIWVNSGGSKFINIRMSPKFEEGSEGKVDMKVIAQTRGASYLEGSITMSSSSSGRSSFGRAIDDVLESQNKGQFLEKKFRDLVAQYVKAVHKENLLKHKSKASRDEIRDLLHTMVGVHMLREIKQLFDSNNKKAAKTKRSAADNLAHHIYTFAKSQSAKSGGFMIARGE